jgi:nucleoid DNA-binding protein
MTKKDLAKRTSDKTNLSAKEATTVLNVFIDQIAESVKNGEQVNLTGFGKFALKYRKERTAYNPFTKKMTVQSASKVPVFKSYKNFKKAVNQ